MPPREARRRHDPTRALGALQGPAVRRPGSRGAARPEPHGLRRPGARGAGAGAPAGARGDGGAREGGDRQPRREAHGRPLLAARAGARARRRRSRARIASTLARDPATSPPTCTPGAVAAAARPSASRNVLVDRHRRLGARPAVRRRRARRRRRPHDAALPRQHRSRRHRPRARRRSATGSTRRWPSSSPSRGGTHGDPQRHARGGGRLPRARASTSREHAVAVTGDGSAARPATRREQGWLARFPMWDWVGGRTWSCRPSACCRRRCRASTSTALLAGARGDGRGDARARDRARTPPRCSRSCGTTPASGRGEKDMVVLPYKDRLLLFSPLPPAARHGVARQGARPRRASVVQPGHRRLRQQGLDRPARLRAAAPRRREQLLRHLHRGAARTATGASRSRSSRASPPATTCTASCSARARRSTRTAASRSRITRRRRRRRAASAC